MQLLYKIKIKFNLLRPKSDQQNNFQKENKKYQIYCYIQRINFDTGFEPTTPRAVDGRDHFSIQTDPFI